MSLQVEAVYENGMLRLDQPLPLRDQERVVLTVKSKESHAKESYGLIRWSGSEQDLNQLLGPDNSPWAAPE